ncbi:phage tail sheath C-terminal domain-containing protein [Clostridium sp.]|uniref:phage tail sheath C-terminal domain-containing protein n=1 Tax=Clostridium sp. TaxID=1506 RepID=UPI0026396AF3|nr:phage tail sheath C-terminal domain-containing protein [Clostridium sp.]
MAITAPNIDISFKQKANTAVERSERGYAILIIRDDTVTTSYVEYNGIDEVDSSDYTSNNYQYIKDMYTFAPYKVCVVRIASADTNISDALTIVKQNVKTGWIGIADGTSVDFETLSSWIATQDDTNKETYKSVVYKATSAPDNMHVVNFVNDYVIFSDTTRGKQAGVEYIPSLIAILAKCNITQGCNYFKCSNLSSVVEVPNNATALTNGQFVLINDGEYVRILRGINSMTTTNGSTKTEDMKEIEVVEAIDIMLDDIRTTFKDDYLGKYKNKYDNQVLFISAVNSYFKSLEDEGVLDDEYDNISYINVVAQRNAWIGVGKTEASTWTDAQVKQNAFKKSLFLSANAKVLESFVDLDFVINLD